MSTTHISTEINRTTGAIECAAEVTGYLLRRSYMGYTKAEARSLFAEAVAKAEADAEQSTVVAVRPAVVALMDVTAAAAIVVRGYTCAACGADGLAADEFCGEVCVDCVPPVVYGLSVAGVDIDAAIAASARFGADLLAADQRAGA